MSENIAKAGKLLCVDSGQYSDYSVHGFFVVLKDFYPTIELKEYLIAHPEQIENYSFSGERFLAMLLAKGLLLEIDYGTIHLTDYACANEFRFTPSL